MAFLMEMLASLIMGVVFKNLSR